MTLNRLLVGAMLAAACAGQSGPGGTPTPVFDHAILPGKRVGPVSLGMTAADLTHVAGRPIAVVSGDGEFTYEYDGYRAVIVERTQRVSSIIVTSGKYALLSGLSVGDADGAMNEQLGAPCEPDPLARREVSRLRYQFRGLNVMVDTQGVVTAFEVVSPKGCL